MQSLVNSFIVGLPLLEKEGLPAPYVIFFEPQMAIQVIMHIVLVLILFYIIHRLLFEPVRKILDERKDKIATEYDKIETTTKEVEDLRAEYEAKLKNINKEADQILAHARKRATERKEELIAEAKDEAKLIKQRTELEISREREQMQDDIRKEIISVATVMASKFIAESLDEAKKAELVNKTFAEMGDDTWQA